MWWCWLALSAGAMEMQWVQEVEVGLRVAPSERSTVLSRARIGTAVEVVEAAGTWRRIRLLGRPLDYPVEGWVVGDTLGGRLRAADLWAESEVATDPEVAVGAAERALALDGSDPIAWEFLGSLREAVEDRGGAEWARRRGLGEVPMWLAVCDGRRVELAARVEPAGEVRGVGARVSLDALAVATWYIAEEPLAGTPFATPFFTNSWNEPDPSAWIPAAPDEIGETTVVLGPCNVAGQVYSTLPLSSQNERAASVARAADVLDTLPGASTLYGLRIRRPSADEDTLEVQLDVSAEWMTCGGVDTSRHRATGIAVLGADGLTQVRFGGPWFDVQQGNTPVSAATPRWFATLSGQMLILADAAWHRSGGVSVAVEHSGDWSIHHQTLRSWGC